MEICSRIFTNLHKISRGIHLKLEVGGARDLDIPVSRGRRVSGIVVEFHFYIQQGTRVLRRRDFCPRGGSCTQRDSSRTTCETRFGYTVKGTPSPLE